METCCGCFNVTQNNNKKKDKLRPEKRPKANNANISDNTSNYNNSALSPTNLLDRRYL